MPLSGQDIAVTILLFFLLAVASAGGIGGGGITVPLLCILGGFGIDAAIPLSVCTIFSGSLVRLSVGLAQRHPLSPTRPLINFALGCTLLPLSLVGTIIGVTFNQISPTWLILLTVFLVLSFTSVKTLGRGIRAWKMESKAFAEVKANEKRGGLGSAVPPAGDGGGMQELGALASFRSRAASMSHSIRGAGIRQQLLSGSAMSYAAAEDANITEAYLGSMKNGTYFDFKSSLTATRGDASIYSGGARGVEMQGRQGKRSALGSAVPPPSGQGLGDGILEEEEDSGAPSPDVRTGDSRASDGGNAEAEAARELLLVEDAAYCGKFFLMLITFAALCLLTLMRGSRSKPSMVGVKACTPASWGLMGAAALLLALSAAMFGSSGLTSYKKKVAGGFEFVEGDFTWTRGKLLKYAPMAVFAGFGSGYLGIGGGMLLGPMLLSMNLNPKVSSATTGFMTLFTSGSGVIQYSVLGMVDWQYAKVLMPMAFVSALAGSLGVIQLMRAYERQSIIVLCLGSVVLVSCVFLTIAGVQHLAQEVASGASFGFHPLCP